MKEASTYTKKEDRLDASAVLHVISAANEDLIRTILEEQGMRDYLTILLSDEFNAAENRGRKQGLERGLERGLEQGLERGLEQGLERGLEQGLEQGMKRGRNGVIEDMLRNGKSPEEISNFTGINLELIKNVQESMLQLV